MRCVVRMLLLRVFQPTKKAISMCILTMYIHTSINMAINIATYIKLNVTSE